jgi:two-component system nitrate/nitrite response regulator NarL
MSAPETLRVMLVEDHIAFRQALAFLLSHDPDLEVVAQAGSLAEARQALDEPAGSYLDVAVVDLGLPDGDGSELIGELPQRNAGVSVVVLSEAINAGRLEGVSKAGAGAVLDKAQSPSTIVREVRRVGSGG